MLIILETMLHVTSGHERTQIAAIDRLTERDDIIILTADTDHQFKDPRTISTLMSHKERLADEAAALKHDVFVIKSLLVTNTSGKPAAVLIPTAHTYDIRLALALLRDAPRAVRFYLRFISDKALHALTSDEQHKLRIAINLGAINLLTEESSLSQHVRKNFNLPITPDLMLPCMTGDSHMPAKIKLDMKPRHHFRLGYLGGLREEKGLDDIPAILRSLNQKLKTEAPEMRIDFVMQRFRGKKNAQKARRFARDLWFSTWRWLPPRQIKITKLPAIMSNEAYAKELANVDALIVPYRLTDYQNRGSGIIIDGLWAGKPIIYSHGMGMTEFLCFGNAEAAASPDEFAEKIITVFKNIAVYQKHGEQAQKALQARFAVTTELLKSI